MTTHNETVEQKAPGYKKGNEESINWLRSWRPIKDKVIRSSKVDFEKGIEAYVRGWLAMHNIGHPDSTHEIVKFEIQEVVGSPGSFTVNVLLDPPAEEGQHDEPGEHGEHGEHGGEDEELGGAHLVPPPPPPPGDQP